jgi:hypothetical protein
MLFSTVDFAPIKAVYTVVQIIQRFLIIKLPKGKIVKLAKVKKQTMTLVIFITKSCKIEIR